MQQSQCRTYTNLSSVLQAGGLHDDHGHAVRVAVAGGPPVLQVPISLSRDLPGDADAASTVSHPRREVVDRRGFVTSGKSSFVVFSLIRIILLDMTDVVLAQLVDGLLNVLHATLLPHGLSGVVAVGPSSIPITLHWLGVKGHNDSKVFRHPLQKVPCYPQVISHINTLSRPHLELPLCWHNLSIGARDADTSVQAAPVVGLHHVPTIHLVSPHPTVVRALRSGKTILRP